MGIDSARLIIKYTSTYHQAISMAIYINLNRSHAATIQVNYYSVYVQLIITMNRVIPYLYLDIRT